MLEIPNLNVVYEDDLCTVMIHDIAGEGELLVVHVEVIPTTKRSVLQHYYEVIEGLFDQLRARGRTEIEAWVNTDEEIRFAQYFGFDEFMGELMVNEQPCLPAVYRMKKRLI